MDYDGDGKEDIVSTEVWGCLSVLDADLRRRAGARLPRGRGVLLEYWDVPKPGEVKALVCTENGLGLLDLTTLEYAWQHRISPINDCIIGDVDGDGGQELALAKHDGYVLVYNGSGELVRRLFVGEAVRALALVKDTDGVPVLALAVPGRILAIRHKHDARSVLAHGDFTLLRSANNGHTLLAFGQGAAVEAYSVPAAVD